MNNKIILIQEEVFEALLSRFEALNDQVTRLHESTKANSSENDSMVSKYVKSSI